MKFALFIVCTLLAVQGLQARSVEVEPANVRGISDIIAGIGDAVARLVQLIADIAAQLSQIIAGIANQIQQIATQVGQIIAGIQETINELIEQGEIAAACVESQREQIEDLISFANQGLQTCTAEAQAQTVALQEQVSILIGRVQALQNDIVNSTAACVRESSGPISLIRCLNNLANSIAEQITAIQADVQTTIAEAQNAAVNAINALVQCSQQLQQDIAERQRKLLQDIRQCIADNQPAMKIAY